MCVITKLWAAWKLFVSVFFCAKSIRLCKKMSWMPGDPGSVLTRNVMMRQGVSGAVFASPEVQERAGNVTESSISFKPFDAWTPQSDWSMSLDKGEEAQVHMCKTLPLLIWFV
jgi:hypothetical protein